jgi:hypothetical protein
MAERDDLVEKKEVWNELILIVAGLVRVVAQAQGMHMKIDLWDISQLHASLGVSEQYNNTSNSGAIV